MVKLIIVFKTLEEVKMKKILFALIFVILLSSCSSIEKLEPTIEFRVEQGIEEGVLATVAKYTKVPTNTPYATYTAYPTLTPNPTLTPKIMTWGRLHKNTSRQPMTYG